MIHHAFAAAIARIRTYMLSQAHVMIEYSARLHGSHIAYLVLV